MSHLLVMHDALSLGTSQHACVRPCSLLLERARKRSSSACQRSWKSWNCRRPSWTFPSSCLRWGLRALVTTDHP